MDTENALHLNTGMYTQNMKKILFLIFTMTVLASCVKNNVLLPKTTSSNTNTPETIAQEWTHITQKYWDSIHGTGKDAYVFPAFDFSYPSAWKFYCCGDMDNASRHAIYSAFLNNGNEDESKPYATITNEWMAGCRKEECSLEENEKLSPEEKLREITNRMRKSNNQIVSWPKKLSEKFGEKFVFEWIKPGEKDAKHYWIQLNDASIWIDLYHVDNQLEQEFFDHMKLRVAPSENNSDIRANTY